MTPPRTPPLTPPRDREAGLTLLEVLVTLAIIGVMAGVTVLGLGALDRGNRAEAEAMRLADRLQLAADRALVSSAPLALLWDARGYRFVRWDAAGDAWRASDARLLAERHDLPSALRLERPDVAGHPPVVISLDFPQPPAQFRLAGGGGAWAVSFDGLGVAVSAPAR